MRLNKIAKIPVKTGVYVKAIVTVFTGVTVFTECLRVGWCLLNVYGWVGVYRSASSLRISNASSLPQP